MHTAPDAGAVNPYAPPGAEVQDVPEAGIHLRPAGRGERLLAAVIDVATLVIVLLPLLTGADLGALLTGADPRTALDVTGAPLAGVAALTLIAITIRLVHANGQTVGKKMIGIKVVRSDGSRASLGRIFWLRNVVSGLPGAIPVLGDAYVIVDHLFIFGGRLQCVHDRIADTIVVKG